MKVSDILVEDRNESLYQQLVDLGINVRKHYAGLKVLDPVDQVVEKLMRAGLATPQKDTWVPVSRETALADFGDEEMAGDYLVIMREFGEEIEVSFAADGEVSWI
jgi:hypothetical protein